MGEQLGRRFAEALGRKDAEALKALLRTDVSFRAMTPGDFWESSDRDQVVDEILLGKWFEPSDEITDIVSIETSTVGPRQHVGYRFNVSNPDGRYLVDQQAYLESDGEAIGWLRVMCAGFLPNEG
jgi:hypothetical protein